jgi:hypothetical protein
LNILFELSTINSQNFENNALAVFHEQASQNCVYKAFIHHLNINPSQVSKLEDIPFLPIDFFKTHKVKTGDFDPVKIFKSSGTSQMTRSSHFIKDINLYETSFKLGFEYFYGAIQDYCILALLPSYLENPHSSLIYMIDQWIRLSENENSAYVNADEQLIELLKNLNQSKQPTILIGVSYALWELAEKFKLSLPNIIFMETGGMKGRRKELVRNELHEIIKSAFDLKSIHSEYGMGELLSQAYSKEKGLFYAPPWMKVFTRPINEPKGKTIFSETGLIKIIDLANIHSCAFIETSDLGKVYQDGSFEILGRLDNADVRGCNLLVQ